MLRRLQQIRERIEADSHLPLTLAGIAREAGIGVDTLQRQFRAAFGITVIEHLREHRLQHARHAIEAGSPISSAAYAAGYNSRRISPPRSNGASALRRSGCGFVSGHLLNVSAIPPRIKTPPST